MHFMLQKEVVDRMAAAPGSKAYGRLGIMLGCHLNVESLFDVDRIAFDPPPDVTVGRCAPRPAAAGHLRHCRRARAVYTGRDAFMQRRKTMRNSLKTVVETGDFEAVGSTPACDPSRYRSPTTFD